MSELTHLSLFSGIGGIDLAAEWAGFKTILFVEIDKYCQKVLNKHWPDVPIIGDIKDVTKEVMENARCGKQGQCGDTDQESLRGNGTERPTNQTSRPSGESEINGRPRNTNLPITLITGGFPCQPVSQAGKRKGKEDDRWLWPEMLRVIKEVRPRWVVAENVAGLIRMGIDDCISDLENQGYTTETYLIPACAVNAPHRRDRIFIVGYSTKLHQYASDNQRTESKAQVPKSGNSSGKADVANTAREGLPNRGRSQMGESREKKPEPNRCNSSPERLQDDARSQALQGWWATEPDVGRVAHGISRRVDRLKCLGNAVVPQQIYSILKAIADIERVI